MSAPTTPDPGRRSDDQGPQRVQKLIARVGLASRRGAEQMIAAGRVTVDGRVARLGDRADPATALIMVDGVRLPVQPGLVYYVVNKPVGTISTSRDPQGRPTVVDLVPHAPAVFTVGRLDADTTGLLILTNDGDLAARLTHPRHGVTKTYVALVEGAVSNQEVRALVTGVELDDGRAAAVAAKLEETRGDRSRLEIVMGEGRNREVRRMCEAMGHPVVSLHRTAIGPLRDPSLKPGAFRALSVDEVRGLYAAAGN